MRRSHRVGLLAAAFGVTTLVALTAPLPGTQGAADGQPGGVVGEGQVVAWSFEESPPAGVRQLSSLAGAGFWVPVTGSVFGTSFTDQDGTFTAGPGGELVLVSAELDTFDPPLGQVSFAYTPVSLSVRFAGHSVALPESPAGSVSGVAGSTSGETGTQYSSGWLVAVPDGAPVTLCASEGAFSQAVDLRSGSRVGTAPVVLYRDPAGPF